MNTILPRTALYIRVSTGKQAKEGDSLEAQETALKEYAKKHNHIVVDTYIDGGESGQKINRTNLQRLLNDVKKNKIDVIIMTKLDRWFRSIKDFYKVQEILSKHNVTWKTIFEDYDTSTASGELWLNMSLSLGQMEAKRTGERINNVFDLKYNVQKTVCTGSVPYGYKISKEKKLIINKKEAEKLRLLYNKYIETNHLNNTTIWFQENCEKRDSGIIRKYLTNTAYIGDFKRKSTGEIVKGYSPQIIEKEVFYKVQDLLNKNIKKKTGKNKNTEAYIFNGMVRCGRCGRRMTGSNKTLRSGYKHYYRCKRAEKGSLCDYKYTFPELKIEEYLIFNIIKTIDKKIKVEDIKGENKKINRSSEYKRKINKLTDLYVNELIDIEHYKKEYAKYNELLAKEKSHIEPSIDYKTIKKEFEKTISPIYDSLTNEEKRRLWTSIIDKIILDDKEVKGIELISH